MSITVHDRPEVAPAAADIATLASSWASAASARVRLTTDLVLAEAKLAFISLSLMMFLAMLAAAFVLAAWTLAIAGLCYGVAQLGIPLWISLPSLVVLHAVAANRIWRMVSRISQTLDFPMTRQQFAAFEYPQDHVD